MTPRTEAAGLDVALVANAIDDGLSAALHRRVGVVDVTAVQLDSSSSFLSGRLWLTLDDGTAVSVFCKDLSPANQLAEARLVRDGGLERSRRERAVYEQLLPRLSLGTPALYGCDWDDDAGRYWLFLEDVGPRRLSRLGDVDLWVAACGWLGRFHRAVHSLSLELPLPAFDAGVLRTRAGGAVDVLGRVDGEVAAAVRSCLGRLDRLVDAVAALPAGVVHGEFFGKNVVIRPGPADEPIATIDWETAAVGPQYVDLACMTAGRWTVEQRLAMRRAYFDAMGPDGELDWGTFNDGVDAAAVLNALAWLGWWGLGDDAHVRRWGAEVRFVTGQRGRIR